jgi:hypothetical protein
VVENYVVCPSLGLNKLKISFVKLHLVFLQLLTDKYYGTCVDEVIKAQRRYTKDVYQFVFDYHSPDSTDPQWMGK